MGGLLILPILTFLSTLVSALDNNLVTTLSGRIIGEIVYQDGKAVNAYLGIPYAKPPLKNLRFKKPKPFDPWDGTLQAKAFLPGCVQFETEPGPFDDNLPGLSEDCLYLNIWTPANSNRQYKMTVMFWIHGGGFESGSTRMDKYNGQVLAAEGNVIVVTINYRLGAAGFFYSGTEDAPGNMGIWDIVEALKWVRRNIGYFGGDKDSITLFGESAGGISIGMFHVSPVTRGLFKNAIMESGSPTLMDDGVDNNKDCRVSQNLARTAGCAPDEDSLQQHPQAVVACMRRKNAFELARLLTLDNVTNSYRFFYPRYGDDLFPTFPRQSFLDGDFAPGNLLIGSNNVEGAARIYGTMQAVSGTYGEKYPQINITLGKSIIREAFRNLKFVDAEALVRHYLGGLRENDYDEIRLRIISCLGDVFIICPSVYFAERFAKKKPSKVYYYFFTHRPSVSPYAPWMLSVHLDEVEFVFGLPLRYPQSYTLEEQELSKRMMHAWSSFAKTGKPTDGVWPLYSQENPVHQVLDEVGVYPVGIGPRRQHCDFLRPYFRLEQLISTCNKFDIYKFKSI